MGLGRRLLALEHTARRAAGQDRDFGSELFGSHVLDVLTATVHVAVFALVGKRAHSGLASPTWNARGVTMIWSSAPSFC
jgi:hypothetical protein